MTKGSFPVESFRKMETPFYYYDTQLLAKTLQTIKEEAARHEGFAVHYAVKANANPKALRLIASYGMGADCVSGGEIKAALDAGFSAKGIVYAGVGKKDWEINLGLEKGILCFNVESLAELEVINDLAGKAGKVADICLRVIPDVRAHTHKNITTGLAENKFGIALCDLFPAIEEARKMPNIHFIGIHFHIGSQILDMLDFVALCNRINDIQSQLRQRNIKARIVNVGGGLGVDYTDPEKNPIPDFKSYFQTFARHLHLWGEQQVHFELGRAVVAQMGSLITQTLYVKHGVNKKFVIVDAGMSDLIRPALYQAYHKIENISSEKPLATYDVVGPICESSDVFGKHIDLNETQRGDLIAIRSAGAYGEIMASQYNCRPLPKGYLTEDLLQA